MKDTTTTYDIPMRAERVRDMPERLRPRELADRIGVENVSDDVLLAIILRSGVKGVNVVELSRQLMQEYGSFTALAQASVNELAAIKGLGQVKAQVLKCALDIGRRMIEEAVPQREAIHTPEQAAKILRLKTRAREEESFWVLGLDAKNRIKRAPIEISRGVLDASLVHPREVFREAIRSACAAVIVGHNHPSGDPTPSAEDIRITRQLIEAGKIINIAVLDHVIIGHAIEHGGSDFISLRETGLINFEV